MLRASLLAAAVWLGCSACERTHCDPSFPWVPVVVPTGRAALASFAGSGACMGQGSAADCALDSPMCADTTSACSCTIYSIRVSPTAATPTCHIEVTSTSGTVFQADVQIINIPSEGCLTAIANPPMIVADFAEGRTGDGSAD